MKVGFTGTREGMTEPQSHSFRKLLNDLKAVEFHHGDCVGADAEAARITNNIGEIFIVVHPPTDKKLRAFYPLFDELMAAKDYLARNRDIVDVTDILIATPKEMREQSKGGTWYTVRYAMSKGKEYCIIWPDGKMFHMPAIAAQKGT